MIVDFCQHDGEDGLDFGLDSILIGIVVDECFQRIHFTALGSTDHFVASDEADTVDVGNDCDEVFDVHGGRFLRFNVGSTRLFAFRH